MRPATEVHLINEHITASEGPRARLTIDGGSVEGIHGLLLEPFCSSPLPQIDVRRVVNGVDYVLAGDGVGPGSAQNLVFAQVAHSLYYRYRLTTGPRKRGGGADVEQPVKTMVLDMLLHEDVWPESQPELYLYDTRTRGAADPNDSSRDCDRLDLLESVDYMGLTTTKFRVEEIPNYLEMLDHVCGRLGWDGNRFRGYRCRVQYPFYGSQVSIVFDPPEGPR